MPAASLAGRTFINTRPRHQSDSLSRRLSELGAKVIEAPAIRIDPPESFEPLDQALAELDGYDWIVFTSVNGVDAFFARSSGAITARIAAIGPATAEAIESQGFSVAIVPERFVAESVFDALELTELSGKRCLLPRADIARETLPRLLRGAGADVDVVTAYRTSPASEDIARAATLVRDRTVDAVTFTSGSTVRCFFDGMDPKSRDRVVPASIGPITSQTLRERGVEPRIEASPYTTEGLAEAISRYFGGRAVGRRSPHDESK